jgi:MFS family permease
LTGAAAGIRLRYISLSALRWFPGGLVIPVIVLLPTARGMSLPKIGLLAAIYTSAVVLLDVPAGALADMYGRRQVLCAASLINVFGCALFAIADTFWIFGVAQALMALGRALNNGPLDAWYVDATKAADPDADVSKGFGRAESVLQLSLGMGALTALALIHFVSGLPSHGNAPVLVLSTPVLAAIPVMLLNAIATWWLVTDTHHTRHGAERGISLTALPDVVRSGFAIARGHVWIRLVLLSAATAGFATQGMEQLGPRLLDQVLHHDERTAAAVFSIVFLGSYLASAVSAAATSRAQRAFRGPRTALGVGLVAAGLFSSLIGATSFVVSISIAYSLTFFFLGIRNPMEKITLSGYVDEQRRATVMSVRTLAQTVGTLAGSLTLPLIAATEGYRDGFLTVAGAFTATGFLIAGKSARRLSPEQETRVTNPASEKSKERI